MCEDVSVKRATPNYLVLVWNRHVRVNSKSRRENLNNTYVLYLVLCQLGRLANRKESTRSAFQKMRLFEKKASRIAGDSAGN